MKKEINLLRNKHIFAIFGMLISVLSTNLQASTAPVLGSVENFAVLAASTVTNTGPSVISGDLGLSPGTAINGFPPGLVSGIIHGTDVVAAQAQIDLSTAYANLENQNCDVDLSGQNLGGLILTPGTYCFSSSAQLTGTLTLNAEGDPNAVFLFQTGSNLTTHQDSKVQMINAGKVCNVFWQVGSSATLGKRTEFIGSILAKTSIIINKKSSILGRALAKQASVVIHESIITKSLCEYSQTNQNYNFNCEFISTGKNPIACLVNGSICINNPQSDFPCPMPTTTINISCDNGLNIFDSQAQSYYDNLLLMIKGEQLATTAIIETQNFNNESGEFESSMTLESKGLFKELEGICLFSENTK